MRYHSRKQRAPIQTLTTTAFPSLDIRNTVDELNEKGFATGLVLPPDYLSKILAFCAETKYFDDYSKEGLQIDLFESSVPRAGRLTYRTPNPHKSCQTVDNLTRDPAIVQVARGYLRTEPLLRSSRIFWSYPDTSYGYNPLYGFHYDIDDYKFLKVFFYLCNVDLATGPHVIIEGTHKSKNWFEKNHRRLTDEQAESRYGERIKIMTGDAGYGFFEDTFCYHKGTKPRNRRLILEFQYAISAAAII